MNHLFSSIGCVWASAALLTSCATGTNVSVPAKQVSNETERCAQLSQRAESDFSALGLKISAAQWQEAGTEVTMRDGKASAPAHCLVEGHFADREGVIGGPYQIAFRMRLPANWNGRFYFQGGGGSNGVVGDAMGFNGPGNPLALNRGYAVIAQDSGHNNAINNMADHQGDLVFGFDPEARRNYGHASLKPTYDIGRFLVSSYYGRSSDTNIFWGCSKGGQEGMAFAQRYPDAFDGIVAIAPGMSLPRAALSQAWDTQAFAHITQSRQQPVTVDSFKTLYSRDQLGLIAESSLAACDGKDGTRDGIIGAVGSCTTALVEPELRKRQCTPSSNQPCLDESQIDALIKVMEGPRDSTGKQLYAPFTWDSGIGAPGWSVWKIGIENGTPSLNIVLGGGSLAAVFTSPPTALSSNPQTLLDWQMAFDFDADTAKLYAASPPFSTSPWQDVGMRSTDLSAFREHGGKLIVPHGVSDPVFSIMDTISWWNELNARDNDQAADFARVFPVPGMNHCGGGPATDKFDSLSALENWVVGHAAPDSISAKAGPASPWPGKEMPLCAYPNMAIKTGEGADAAYQCQLPPQ